MGEYLRRDSSDPSYVPDGKGMDANSAKYFQAVALAAQMGKTVEEVLAFMGVPSSAVPKVSPVIPAQTVAPQPTPELPPALQDAKVFLPADEDVIVEEPKQENKAKATTPKEVPSDGFVVTETIDPEQATQAELDQAFPEEENNWDGKIREGSKVRVTYSTPGSRIKWAGKVGKCIRVIGNEKAKVYEVEFKGQRIAKVRLNKKTGKLERGYENKRLVTTFDQEDIELYS